MTKDNPNFSKRLNELMKQHGMTVKRASEITGSGVSTVQSWRAGSLSTDYQALQKLAKALGVSMEYLLTGENDTVASFEELIGSKEDVFEGFLQVKIQRVIPKRKTKK